MKTYIVTKNTENHILFDKTVTETNITFVTNSPTKLLQYVQNLNVEPDDTIKHIVQVFENEIETHLNYISESFQKNIKNFIKNIK